MKESDRTTLFLKYARAKIKHSFAFEAKICKEKSLPFSDVKEHQENALLKVRNGLFNYKIPDDMYSQKPFDGFQMVEQPAYVVIYWYQKRADRRFTMININNWMEEKNNSKRKSITYERAEAIAFLADKF